MSESMQFFIETFRMMNTDSRKCHYRISSKNFNLEEQQILNAYYAYKIKDLDKTFSLLKKRKYTNPLREGLRLYLLGLANNHICKYSFATESLFDSLRKISLFPEYDLELYPLTALVISLSNQNDLKRIDKVVQLIDKYPPTSEHSELTILHAKIVYHNLLDNDKSVRHFIAKAKASKAKTLNLFLPNFLLIEFALAIKHDDFKDCYKILEEYKRQKGFSIKANYKFIKILLDHITMGEKLYVYDKDFDSHPELHQQLQVIKALCLGDYSLAKESWSLLCKHNKEVYQDDFIYNAPKCLFSIALKLNLNKVDSIFDIKYLNEKIKTIKKAIDKLDFIFTHSSTPIHKEILINLIWNEEMNESTENRLRVLINKYKKVTGISISTYQGTYTLSNAA